MSAFQPSANTAAAVGLFTALLAVDDQINKPLGLWLACPAVFARHSNRCGKLQTYGTWIRSDISRKIAQSPGISDSPPPSFGQRISQQLHLHPQLDQLVVPFLLFADRAFARSAFRLRNIAVGEQPLFAVLVTNKPFDLFFAQSETGTNLPVRFSRGFSPEHFLTERLYFCILSGHDNTSCCSFYSTTEGAFFHCPFGGYSPECLH